jgi:hypothetical protein
MTDRMETEGYDRVRARGSKAINARRDRDTEERLRRAKDDPEYASHRLAELEREWEIDRAILLAFAGMGAAGLVLGVRKSSRWRFPIAAQVGSLLLYSIVGWSPQAAVLRRLGFRTRQEIDTERNALLSAGRLAEAR